MNDTMSAITRQTPLPNTDPSDLVYAFSVQLHETTVRVPIETSLVHAPMRFDMVTRDTRVVLRAFSFTHPLCAYWKVAVLDDSPFLVRLTIDAPTATRSAHTYTPLSVRYYVKPHLLQRQFACLGFFVGETNIVELFQLHKRRIYFETSVTPMSIFHESPLLRPVPPRGGSPLSVIDVGETAVARSPIEGDGSIGTSDASAAHAVRSRRGFVFDDSDSTIVLSDSEDDAVVRRVAARVRSVARPTASVFTIASTSARSPETRAFSLVTSQIETAERMWRCETSLRTEGGISWIVPSQIPLGRSAYAIDIKTGVVGLRRPTSVYFADARASGAILRTIRGAGRMRTILHLAQCHRGRTVPSFLVRRPVVKNVLPSLIIVPHARFARWVQECRTCCVSALCVQSEDVLNTLTLQEVNDADIVLLSSKLVPRLVDDVLETARSTQYIFQVMPDTVLQVRTYEEADVTHNSGVALALHVISRVLGTVLGHIATMHVPLPMLGWDRVIIDDIRAFSLGDLETLSVLFTTLCTWCVDVCIDPHLQVTEADVVRLFGPFLGVPKDHIDHPFVRAQLEKILIVRMQSDAVHVHSRLTHVVTLVTPTEDEHFAQEIVNLYRGASDMTMSNLSCGYCPVVPRLFERLRPMQARSIRAIMHQEWQAFPMLPEQQRATRERTRAFASRELDKFATSDAARSKCPVCNDNAIEVITLCGHSFCAECLALEQTATSTTSHRGAFTNRPLEFQCPMCRSLRTAVEAFTVRISKRARAARLGAASPALSVESGRSSRSSSPVARPAFLSKAEYIIRRTRGAIVRARSGRPWRCVVVVQDRHVADAFEKALKNVARASQNVTLKTLIVAHLNTRTKTTNCLLAQFASRDECSSSMILIVPAADMLPRAHEMSLHAADYVFFPSPLFHHVPDALGSDIVSPEVLYRALFPCIFSLKRKTPLMIEHLYGSVAEHTWCTAYDNFFSSRSITQSV